MADASEPRTRSTGHAPPTELAEKLRGEISRVMVGLDEVVEEVLAAFLSGGHVLLEGVPGIGKTLLVRTLAQSLDLSFRRIQLTPDLMPADITGTNLIVEADGKKSLVFQEGPVFAHVVLADEINRATPRTQSALLESMGERQVTVSGETRPLPDPFFLLATQNPIEMEGTYPLPEAELDRFQFKVRVPPPRREELMEILVRGASAPVDPPRPVLVAEQVRALQESVRGVVTPEPVLRYVVELLASLTPDPADPGSEPSPARWLRHGPGPRGGLALVLGGKALALLEGRPDLSFADVERLARPALRHRLILTFEAEAEGVDPDAIIEEALDRAPRASRSVQRWENKLKHE